MIEREKLEKLAKVMGGGFFPFTHPGWDCAIWHQDHGEIGKGFAMYKACADGFYERGTLESMEQKVREWVDGTVYRVISVDYRYWKNGDLKHELTFFLTGNDLKQFRGDSRLSTLIDAILWIAEQEQGGKA